MALKVGVISELVLSVLNTNVGNLAYFGIYLLRPSISN